MIVYRTLLDKVDRLESENKQLRDGIREQHKPSPWDGLCITCASEGPENGQVDGFLDWPCPTARLLDDQQEYHNGNV